MGSTPKLTCVLALFTPFFVFESGCWWVRSVNTMGRVEHFSNFSVCPSCLISLFHFNVYCLFALPFTPPCDFKKWEHTCIIPFVLTTLDTLFLKENNKIKQWSWKMLQQMLPRRLPIQNGCLPLKSHSQSMSTLDRTLTSVPLYLKSIQQEGKLCTQKNHS